MRFWIELEPPASWRAFGFDVVPSLDGGELGPHVVQQRFGEQRARIRRSLRAWNMHVPQLSASWDDLGQAYAAFGLRPRRAAHARQRRRRAAAGRRHAVVHDRVRARHDHHVPADARLRARARAHGPAGAGRPAGRDDDPGIDAEPGKIIHELRRGRAAEVWFPRYYGTVDATPLFLVLLSETWRWTADDGLVRELEPALRRALALDRRVRRSRRRRLRRVPAPLRHGLAVQSWKDSPDSQRFADGRVAERRSRRRGPGLRLRRQAALRRARTRRARRRARWPSGSSARPASCASASTAPTGSSAAAASTRSRSTGASDRSTAAARTWATCCGAGSCRTARVRRRRAQPDGAALWSGWGVRTMSAEDEAYRPLAYHNGTVWPHDNSLIAHGLARCAASPSRAAHPAQHARGLALLRRRPARGLRRLARRDTPFPVAYPTASRPQAWAAGAPVLLLRVLLGLEPDRVRTSYAQCATATSSPSGPAASRLRGSARSVTASTSAPARATRPSLSQAMCRASPGSGHEHRTREPVASVRAAVIAARQSRQPQPKNGLRGKAARRSFRPGARPVPARAPHA